jgi:hypothetical protein
MDDLDKYVEKRKKQSPIFAQNYDKGYEQFKIGVLLKQARIDADLTQEDEIIEELWRIKDNFSSSCNEDMGKIIETMNKIAEKEGFSDNRINKKVDYAFSDKKELRKL